MLQQEGKVISKGVLSPKDKANLAPDNTLLIGAWYIEVDKGMDAQEYT